MRGAYLSERKPERSGPAARPSRFCVTERIARAVARSVGSVMSTTAAAAVPTVAVMTVAARKISVSCVSPGPEGAERGEEKARREEARHDGQLQAHERKARAQPVRDQARDHRAHAAQQHDEPGLQARAIGREAVVAVEVTRHPRPEGRHDEQLQAGGDARNKEGARLEEGRGDLADRGPLVVSPRAAARRKHRRAPGR